MPRCPRCNGFHCRYGGRFYRCSFGNAGSATQPGFNEEQLVESLDNCQPGAGDILVDFDSLDIAYCDDVYEFADGYEGSEDDEGGEGKEGKEGKEGGKGKRGKEGKEAKKGGKGK